LPVISIVLSSIRLLTAACMPSERLKVRLKFAPILLIVAPASTAEPERRTTIELLAETPGSIRRFSTLPTFRSTETTVMTWSVLAPMSKFSKPTPPEALSAITPLSSWVIAPRT
jgi:hypothetical protein